MLEFAQQRQAQVGAVAEQVSREVPREVAGEVVAREVGNLE